MLTTNRPGSSLPWPLSKLARRVHSQALYSAYHQALPLGMGYVELVLDCIADEGFCRAGSSMFSIGPGTGRIELAWLARTSGQLGYIERHEPYHARLLRQSARLGFAKRICAAHLGDFREFDSEQRYDCVISVQSWFGLWQDRACLTRALRLRNRTGKLIIVLRGEQDELRPFVHTGTGERTAEQLSDWATEIGYPHRRVVIDHEVAAEEFREGKRLSSAARALFGFLNYRPWRLLARDLRRAIENEFLERTAPVRRPKLALIFDSEVKSHA